MAALHHIDPTNPSANITSFDCSRHSQAGFYPRSFLTWMKGLVSRWRM